MTNPDTRLIQRARALYGEATRHVDQATRARLHAARLQALSATRDERSLGARHWLLPSGAFAVATLAAVMLWQPLQRAPAPAATAPSAQAGDADNDLPADASQIDPKLYQNLDFYGWLASNDSAMGRQ